MMHKKVHLLARRDHMPNDSMATGAALHFARWSFPIDIGGRNEFVELTSSAANETAGTDEVEQTLPVGHFLCEVVQGLELLAVEVLGTMLDTKG